VPVGRGAPAEPLYLFAQLRLGGGGGGAVSSAARLGSPWKNPLPTMTQSNLGYYGWGSSV